MIIRMFEADPDADRAARLRHWERGVKSLKVDVSGHDVLWSVHGFEQRFLDLLKVSSVEFWHPFDNYPDDTYYQVQVFSDECNTSTHPWGSKEGPTQAVIGGLQFTLQYNRSHRYGGWPDEVLEEAIRMFGVEPKEGPLP